MTTPNDPAPPPVRRVLETCLYCEDVARARDWYRSVLGLKESAFDPPRHVFFPLGEGMLLIFDPTETSNSSSELPSHGATGPGHLAFEATENELERWKLHLQSKGVTIEKAIDWPNGGKSFYFRDPDGNSLEFATARLWR